MTDPERLFETLVEANVLAVDDEDRVTTTEDFETVRDLYHDVYDPLSEDEYYESVAGEFGLEGPEAAAEAIEDLGVTREGFVAYLALKSHLDAAFTREELARMAAVVTQVGPSSAVPAGVEEIDDEGYEAFLADHPDAVVTVWRRNCAPCDAMKDDLDGILAAIPEGVAVAGIEPVPPSDFRRNYRVDAAPAALLFRDGQEEERFTGRTDPETLAEAFAEVYSS
jgi:thiol-disulfide isomerase/thioredoxin